MDETLKHSGQNEKKVTLWKKILIVLIVGVVILIMYIVFFSNSRINSYPYIESETQKFAKYLAENNSSAAYSLTSTEYQNTDTIADYDSFSEQFHQNFNGLQNIENTVFYTTTYINKPKTYYYEGIFTDLDGKQGGLNLTFVKEGEDFKILNMQLLIETQDNS